MSVTIKEALQEAVSFLHLKGLSEPRLEAELLLAFILKKERIYLYTHGEETLSREAAAAYRETVVRRGAREPLAYITGEKEFMGLAFAVGEGVLIPRPETEHLVEAVLHWVKKRTSPAQKKEAGVRILDLGTGCGNIALSLLVLLPLSKVTAIDSEEKAAAYARFNAERLGVEKRFTLIYGKYWDDLAGGELQFDVVVSNPPYIPTPVLSSLPGEVLREPRAALDGGKDGLEAYRKIFGKVAACLRSPGLLALEVGMGQAEEVCKMATEYAPGVFRRTEICRDYAGIERVVLFER